MIRFLIVVVLFNSCVLGQRGSFLGQLGPALCTAVGNYCVESRDCCSKSCNNSTNRCIESVETTTVRLLTSTLDSRFGADSNPCQKVGASCQTGRECCSGDCLVSSQKCIISNNNHLNGNQTSGQGQKNEKPICGAEHQQCSSSKSCCAFLSCEGNVCRDKAVLIDGTESFGYNPNNNLPNRFGENDNSTNSAPQQNESPLPTTSQVPFKCLEVGSKCYVASECCYGLKCHGFLHKCVT